MALSRSIRHVVLSGVILLGLVVSVYSSRYVAEALGKSSGVTVNFSATDMSAPSWFLAHPVLGILGAVTLPVPAIILRKYKGYWSKKIHAYVLGVSLVVLFGCVYVAYAHKDARGKHHLMSYHAKAGASLVSAYLLFSFMGAAALDPDYAFISDKEKKALFKWVHKTWGRLSLVIGYWICFSGWAKFFEGSTLYAGAGVAAGASFLTYLDPIVGIIMPEGKVE